MSMRSFLGIYSFFCSTEVLFFKFLWFLAFMQVYFSDIYIFLRDHVTAVESIV